ncbi:MAG: conjugative transposon protein TraM [Sphingobacteriales bacterium 50-39]|nr:conjugative transposon protein TraM [Sphingobacteriales bacterium]OJW59385.1 MAG: conjugative transposon protein TraM [Sphingobacteriales bacterium 50-39]
MEQQHSQRFRQQRKLLVAAPLLALPFLCMFFWALGGGKGTVAKGPEKTQHGLNVDLPNAKVKDDKRPDKMAYYEQADQDSAKMKERLKNEAFYEEKLSARSGFGPVARPPAPLRDSNETKVYSKLNELNNVLSSAPKQQIPDGKAHSNGKEPIAADQIDRLENMLLAIKGGGSSGRDPEMDQLNSTLDKLVAVQHPELINDSLKTLTRKHEGTVYPVSGKPSGANIRYLLGARADSGRHLSTVDEPLMLNNTIRAMVPEDQTLVSGATVRLEITEPMFVGGASLPAGTKLFGTASLTNERLSITITSIRGNNNIYPVSLQVYDQDGLQGLYIPGAITRDVAKQSTDQGLSTLGTTTLDPSFGAQAAGAGLEMARNMLSRKIKLVRVLVKGGYQVLLKDARQHSSNSNN